MPIESMTNEEINEEFIKAHRKIHEKYNDIEHLQDYMRRLDEEYCKRHKEDNLPF